MKQFGMLVLLALFLSACSSDPGPDTGFLSPAVMIGGTLYSQQDMAQFDGTVLHYVITPEAQEQGYIYAFLKQPEVQHFVEVYDATRTGELATQLLLKSHFYDLFNYSSKFGTLNRGDQISDLGVHPNYNDNDISSMKCETGAWTVLYDLPNLDASAGSLWCQGGTFRTGVEDLSVYGWNNRASSVQVTN